MDAVPVRLPLALPYRALVDILNKSLVLPKVNPAYYHLLALCLSVLFLYTETPWQKMALIGVVLVTDWLDGATVKRHFKPSKAGYITDVVTDRASEAFIFAGAAETLAGQIFFLLWLVNSALAFYSVRSNKHVALPLRFAYLVLLALPGM